MDIRLNGEVQVFAKKIGTVVTDIQENSEQVLRTFQFHAAYPNPFNPSTNLSFELNESGKTTLVIYDLLGRKVAGLIDENLAAGVHHVIFNGAGLSSGIYLARLRQGNKNKIQRIVLLK